MHSVAAVDAVANLNSDTVAVHRPKYINDYHTSKFGTPAEQVARGTVNDMLRLMDASNVEMAFLLAPKVGQLGLAGSWHIPFGPIADAVAQHPSRFRGIIGIDPTQGMNGVRELELVVKNYGFIGAHLYPHWFELAPDHARYYPFYAKCVELGVPIQMQVGQSMVYAAERPLRSVGRPIALDSVACDFPELKLIGIHVGIPWTDEMIMVAYKHKNVYIGCDAHGPKYWPTNFNHYINTYGQNKVIFGTDWPALSFDRMRREIDELGFRAEPYRKLMRENALKLYNVAI